MAEDNPRKTDQVLASAEHGQIDSETVTRLLDIKDYHAAHILKGLSNHGHLSRVAENLKNAKGRKYIYQITNGGKKRLEWLRKNDRL